MKALVCLLCCVCCYWAGCEEIGPADVHIIGDVELKDVSVEKQKNGIWVRVGRERRWYLNEMVKGIDFKAADTPEAMVKKLELENQALRDENGKLKKMLDDAGVENKKIAAERFKDWKDAEKAEAQATIARDQARKAVSLLDNARQSAEAWQQEAARNQVTTSIATTQAALSNNSASQAQSQANAAYAQMNAAAQQAYQQGVNEGRQRCQAAYQEGYQQGFTNGRSNSYNHVDVRGTINVQQRPGVWIGQ